MAIIATPARRRIIMATLLALATAGAVIRYFAAPGSVLHDIGTLLLVLWLPAVGNLIAWLIRQAPRRAPPASGFMAGSAFVPHLRAQVAFLVPVPSALAALDPREQACTLVAGTHGFTVRLAEPLAGLAAAAGPRELALELLRPDVAFQELRPGAPFHLLVGRDAVAKGQVLELADGGHLPP
ncbi:MAG TPA: hypothetical protein VLK85_03805 [Ramlibacter sp.]|nr:hypothetical protein [Ramlibacter sp.]